MKTLFTLTVFILVTIHGIAQIGYAKNEIVKEYGDDWYIEIDTTNAEAILFYDYEATTEASGTHITRLAMFLNYDVCWMWSILRPPTESNTTYKWLENKFVKISEKKFKNYQDNSIYTFFADDSICFISCCKDYYSSYRQE